MNYDRLSRELTEIAVTKTIQWLALALVTAQPGTQDDGPWLRERFFLSRFGGTRALFMSWQPVGSAVSEARLLDHVSALRFAYCGPPRPDEAPAFVEQHFGPPPSHETDG